MTDGASPLAHVSQPAACTHLVDELAPLGCPVLSTYSEAARLLEVHADELFWTRSEATEVEGLRRGAELLRWAAAQHAADEHPRAGGPSEHA